MEMHTKTETPVECGHTHTHTKKKGAQRRRRSYEIKREVAEKAHTCASRIYYRTLAREMTLT